MAGQFAVEQLLTMRKDQRAVFGDERDLLADLREEGDQLIVLVAAGDNEFNAALLQLGELRQKPCAIVGFGVIEKKFRPYR